MIEPRKDVAAVSRTAQPDDSRAAFLRLDRNEIVPHLDGEIISAIIGRLTPDSFSAYPSLYPLYEELASALGVEVSNILIGAGSDWIIRACFDVFCSADEEVLLPVPTYGMYEVYAALRGARLTVLPYSEDFSLPLAELEGALDRAPRILGLANPNGALGSYSQADELARIVGKAEQQNTLVILDEAYVDYVDDSWLSKVGDYDNLVLVRTFSKAYGLPGLRVGYAVGNADVIAWLSRVRPNVEINQVGVEASRYLLQNPHVIRGHVAATLAGKEALAVRLTACGLDVYRGHANFILVDFGKYREGVLAAFAAARILVKDYSGQGILSRWTRITVGPAPQMNEVANLVEKVVSGD